MQRIDISELKKRVDIIDVIGRRISLSKKGAEHVGICPFHNDSKASLNVNQNKQVFACFACGKKGDVIDFLVDMGATIPEAVAELSGETFTNHTPEKTNVVKRTAVWKQVTPAPNPGQITHYKHGAPAKTWQYLDATGGLLGLICRFDTPDGKEVVPYTYCTDGNRNEWRWQGFEKPRPLYNLDRIAANPTATVLIVEGEKTADAAQLLLPHIVVTTWQGGAKAITNADWKPMAGRNIVFWADNDEPGNDAMMQLAELLKATAGKMKWVRNASEFPEKWDVADADWTPEEALAYVRANLAEIPAVYVPMPDAEQGEPEFEYTPPPPHFGAETEPAQSDEDPFEVLGFTNDQDQMYYALYTRNNHQVQLFRAASMCGNNLLALAPLDWWENEYPSKTARKFDETAAANAIIQVGNRRVFNPGGVRGRGAWMDAGRVVIHVGNRLVVDGQPFDLGVIKTKYVYPLGTGLDFPTENPLGTKEANQLMDIISLCNWERPINAHLLAGWCVIAPTCGALNWRPHIWVTGAAGTGKSWVFKHIVRRLLGKSALAVQSETSEAGLRQTLKNDAIPIVFDEAEGEDKRARERMEAVLSLMRASSAEDGGVMLKGSAGGKAQTYRIRSCFAFASIGVQVTHASDRGRVTILGLTKPIEAVRNDRWSKLKKLYLETITDEYISRLQARTVSLLPVILQNADTFSQAVAFELGEQRAGDQLGALLAGAYSLYSANKISFDDAVEWVKKQNWEEERSLDTSRDEHVLMAKLMDFIIKVDGVNLERSVGELIMIASYNKTDENITSKVAHDRLLRYGFKVDGEFFLVSQSNTNVLKILADTPWQKSIGRTLGRIEGAHSIASARFGPGQISRAVKIPLSWLAE